MCLSRVDPDWRKCLLPGGKMNKLAAKIANKAKCSAAGPDVRSLIPSTLNRALSLPGDGIRVLCVFCGWFLMRWLSEQSRPLKRALL
jgi:hypothetical protein